MNIGKRKEIIERVNRILRGWQQYFDNIAMGKTRNQINRYTELKVAKLISKRNKRKGIVWKLVGHGKLYNKYGLHKMINLGRKFA